MPDVPWTDSQRRAITTIGGSLLVSAGAGSGKTMVLAERCAYLVADAPSPCAVDRLLVVTFTEAAATQMRERIASALRDRLGKSPNDRRLREQLALIDTASISTIHAFCKRTLDRYFAQAGLDPAIQVMDGHEAMILRRETAGEVFDRFGDRLDAA
ncbi:MAG: UvrD-helicase domain-containing protein, partial [Planctomycetota bacterium]|nr:UvrD-helicase domain-containing protein [Planctomycetota bacterium]